VRAGWARAGGKPVPSWPARRESRLPLSAEAAPEAPWPDPETLTRGVCPA